MKHTYKLTQEQRYIIDETFRHRTLTPISIWNIIVDMIILDKRFQEGIKKEKTLYEKMKELLGDKMNEDWEDRVYELEKEENNEKT